MRLFTIFLVLVFVSPSCSHSFKIVNTAATPQYAHYVPKIVFNTEVNAESVAATMAIMDAATEEGAKAIVIEFNTPGGEVDSGFLLAKAIENSRVPVVCVVDGLAASMGMYLLQSCHVRAMTKRSSLMIHEAAVGAQSFYGPEVKWRSIAEELKRTNRAMAEHLAHRMTVSADEILIRIVGGLQWWLDWKDAVNFGAVDLVVDSVQEITDSYRN